jgi:uncharacterized membrane protein YphA (DoxX/SURF4 family)
MFNLDFLNVYSGWGILFLQFAVGIIFIYHGWPKLKGVKKFFGIGGTFHGLVEIIAAAALMLGAYVREAGFALAVIMLGAIYMKKFKWNTPFSSTNTTGWEFDLVLLGAALYFLLG